MKFLNDLIVKSLPNTTHPEDFCISVYSYAELKVLKSENSINQRFPNHILNAKPQYKGVRTMP